MGTRRVFDIVLGTNDPLALKAKRRSYGRPEGGTSGGASSRGVSKGKGTGMSAAEYKRYLRSDDWLRKKRAKHQRKNGTKKRCSICAAEAPLDVHHLRYVSDLTETNQSDLRLLCRRCHQTAHDLMHSGQLVFRSTSHHHRFALTKAVVKKALGLTGVNCFAIK